MPCSAPTVVPHYESVSRSPFGCFASRAPAQPAPEGGTIDVVTAHQPSYRLAETRAFFASRADAWDERFPDDGPAFAGAIAELGLRRGQTVLDAGAGTCRAAVHLRMAVGTTGRVVAVDVTPEMLAVAATGGRDRQCALLQADASVLPLMAASVDAVLAAGLVAHLSDPTEGLGELARVTRSGGRLAVFHPIGRATLAARHGRSPSDDDLLHAPNLANALQASGWVADRIDDADDRYLALATRA